MADIESATVSETAASNVAATPDGAPSNFARTATKNILREIWGGIKRFRNRICVTLSSATSTTAYTLSYTTAPAYVQGLRLAFKVHGTSTGSVTVNVNAAGAKKVYRNIAGTATQVTTGEWTINDIVELSYDTSLDSSAGGFWWINAPAAAFQGISNADITGLSAETTLATDDLLVISDTSEGAANKMTVANALLIVNALTADASPDIDADYVLTYDASAGAAKKALAGLVGGLPRGHIAGLTISNGTDATNDIDIAVGAARDSTNARNLILASVLTKQLDAAWAVGTNAGGLDTGAIANTTYHVWLIKRSDTGVVDALFSTSASSPTMPSNYDYKRRIGSIVRTGGAIKAFVQDGDRFRWLVGVQDVAASNPGTSAVTRTLTLPTGITIWADIAANIAIVTSVSIYGLITALDETDSTPSSSLFNCGGVTTGIQAIGALLIKTNTSAQVRSRISTSAGSDSLVMNTFGWVDTRGRFA